MSNINIITYPDKLFNDSTQILLISPSKIIQEELQNKYLNFVDDDVNIYYYNSAEYAADEIDWLLTVFHMCAIVIIDVDNAQPHVRDLLSYFVAKSKTYWLTNAENTVYTHISNRRVYTLDFLSILGDNCEK